MQSDNSPNIDPLTGLFNSTYGIEALLRAIDTVKVKQTLNMYSYFKTASGDVFWHNGELGIIFADIYDLRSLHDRFGHLASDEIIHDVAKAIQSVAKEADTACRYGGDEFLLIMPNASESETKERVEQMRQVASQVRVSAEGKLWDYITLSIGSAHYPTIYRDFIFKLNGVEALMRFADEDLARDRARNVENQKGHIN